MTVLNSVRPPGKHQLATFAKLSSKTSWTKQRNAGVTMLVLPYNGHEIVLWWFWCWDRAIHWYSKKALWAGRNAWVLPERVSDLAFCWWLLAEISVAPPFVICNGSLLVVNDSPLDSSSSGDKMRHQMGGKAKTNSAVTSWTSSFNLFQGGFPKCAKGRHPQSATRVQPDPACLNRFKSWSHMLMNKCTSWWNIKRKGLEPFSFKGHHRTPNQCEEEERSERINEQRWDDPNKYDFSGSFMTLFSK